MENESASQSIKINDSNQVNGISPGAPFVDSGSFRVQIFMLCLCFFEHAPIIDSFHNVRLNGEVGPVQFQRGFGAPAHCTHQTRPVKWINRAQSRLIGG